MEAGTAIPLFSFSLYEISAAVCLVPPVRQVPDAGIKKRERGFSSSKERFLYWKRLLRSTPAARRPKSAPATGAGAWVRVGETPAAVVACGADVVAVVLCVFVGCGVVTAVEVAVGVASVSPEEPAAVHFA